MIFEEMFFWGIILANIIISFKGFNDLSFFRKNEFHIGSILRGERYRMFSSAFLHADTMHLIFNMITFYFFAPAVIVNLGNWFFLLVYFGSLFLGSFLTLYLEKENYNYRAIGASGAVTGVIYSAILFNPDANLYLFFAIPIPTYLFGIGYLLYSIYGMRAQNDNIGHTAHFGGAIGGYFITLCIAPYMLWSNTKMVVLLAIPIVILFYLMRKRKI